MRGMVFDPSFVWQTPVIMAILLGPVGCTSNNPSRTDVGEPEIDLKNELSVIETGMGDLTAPGLLFRFQSFRTIYDHPKVYEQRAIEAIASPEVNETQKLIIVYAMQQLPVHDYVVFAQEVMRLCQEGGVPPIVLERAICPSYDWSTALAENYRSNNVRSFLTAASRSGMLTAAMTAYVDRIITGKAMQDIREMRRDGIIK
jgi:hypothetical protein